jgi:threonine dehydratase
VAASEDQIRHTHPSHKFGSGTKLRYPIVKRLLGQVVLVPDDAIIRAQQLLWETLRAVAELGDAAAFAALISGRYEPRPGEDGNLGNVGLSLGAWKLTDYVKLVNESVGSSGLGREWICPPRTVGKIGREATR